MPDRFEASAAEYYTGKLLQHGPTPAGVDWNSAESQDLRFEQLMKISSGANDFSLLDFGCGYGALLTFLKSGGICRAFEEIAQNGPRPRRTLRAVGLSDGAARGLCAYWGYDAAPAMLAKARDLHQSDQGCHFVGRLEEVPPVDYSVASGVFNVKQGANAEEWRCYVLETLCRMAALSRRGFAFNLLTSYSEPDRMRESLYYADPCFFFDYCKTRISRHVALLHDYGLYEFTMLVRME